MLNWDEHFMDEANHCRSTCRASVPSANSVFRVLVLAGLGGVSGGLCYGHTGAFAGAVPLWLYAGGIYAASVGASAALIFVFLPKLSQFIQLTAVSRFFFAVVSFWEPDFAAAFTTSPLLNATLVVGGALILRRLLPARPGLESGERRISAGLARLRAG